MILEELSLVNFRCFANTRIQFHPRLSVIVGDNGVGKTALLDGLVLSLGPRLSLYDSNYVEDINSSDIRVESRARGKRNVPYTLDYGRISLDLSLNAENHRIELDWWRDHRDKEVIDDRILSSIDSRRTSSEGLGFHFVWFVYYGTARGRFGQRNAEKVKIDYSNNRSALYGALNPELDLNELFDWFEAEEAEELRIIRNDPSYRSPMLNAVREALSAMFSEGGVHFENPRFETRPTRFVMDRVESNGACSVLEFSQLSDGYKSMVALVMDFARRLAITYQYENVNPLEQEAVMIIDEIDLHLHPSWQKRVISDLQRAFPKTQIIATTHSPFVLSTVEKDSIFIIEKDGENITFTHPEHETAGDDPLSILPQVMNVLSMPSLEINKIYNDYLALIAQNLYEEAEGIALKEQLIKHFGVDHHLIQVLNSHEKTHQMKKQWVSKLK